MKYSNPEGILRIPFPFLGFPKPTDRFAINDENASFDYMGREKFAEVLAEIGALGPYKYRALYVYGTIGYGKSHILAAMTCLLLQQGKRVVYLPDCRAMAADFLEYIKSGLLLAFGDSESHQLRIQKCGSADEIISFCKRIVLDDRIRLYFIVDQLNAPDKDNEGTNKDEVSNDVELHIRASLNRIMYEHFVIESASASYQSAMHMKQKQLSKVKLSLMGGFSEVSYPCYAVVCVAIISHMLIQCYVPDGDATMVVPLSGQIADLDR